MEEKQREGPQGGPTTFNLLFVCTGNTCRSPMAMAIARAEIDKRGWSSLVAVQSAGIAADWGGPASPQAMNVAWEHGADLSDHEARLLTPELVAWADLILVMGHSHLAAVIELGGIEKVALVTDFAESAEHGNGIDDPYGGDLSTYRRSWNQLETVVAAALDRLQPILAP